MNTSKGFLNPALVAYFETAFFLHSGNMHLSQKWYAKVVQMQKTDKQISEFLHKRNVMSSSLSPHDNPILLKITGTNRAISIKITNFAVDFLR